MVRYELMLTLNCYVNLTYVSGNPGILIHAKTNLWKTDLRENLVKLVKSSKI